MCGRTGSSHTEDPSRKRVTAVARHRERPGPAEWPAPVLTVYSRSVLFDFDPECGELSCDLENESCRPVLDADWPDGELH